MNSFRLVSRFFNGGDFIQIASTRSKIKISWKLVRMKICIHVLQMKTDFLKYLMITCEISHNCSQPNISYSDHLINCTKHCMFCRQTSKKKISSSHFGGRKITTESFVLLKLFFSLYIMLTGVFGKTCACGGRKANYGESGLAVDLQIETSVGLNASNLVNASKRPQ